MKGERVRRSRHSQDEIRERLEEADDQLAKGLTISVICDRFGISRQTYYRWRRQTEAFRSSGALGHQLVALLNADERRPEGISGRQSHLREKLIRIERENEQLRNVLVELTLEIMGFKSNWQRTRGRRRTE